jgi:TonB family protein
LEEILVQLNKLFSLLMITGLLVPAAFAGGKDDPHDLLMKSFQQAGLWSQGPVKLVAQVRMPIPTGHDLNLVYTVSWAGPDKWRAEWTADGLQQVTVLNSGKLSYASNQSPLVRAIEFEAAIAALDGGSPAGPYSFPPLDYQKAKIDVSKKKINGMDAKCLAFGQPTVTYCIDSATSRLLSVDGDLGTFEYSDYTTIGNLSYPQTVKVTYVKTLMEDAKITVSRTEKLADALFAAPANATTTDFAACSDLDKNFTAPRLNKLVTAKMPEAAKKAKKYGMVWVLATVDKDGAVQKATVLGGDPDLSAAAKDAVQQYKFTAYMRCGQAVEFTKAVVVPFAPPANLPDAVFDGGR